MAGDQPPVTATPATSNAPPRRVLLVDDQREVRTSTAAYLRLRGFDVIETGDGDSTLEAIRGAPTFDFALLDVSLPDIDGRDLAVQVRQASPTTWIALVTGWSLDPDESLPSEIDGVFMKPVSLPDLCRILSDGPVTGAGPPAFPTQ